MKLKKFTLLLIIALLPVVAYTAKAKSDRSNDAVLLDTIYPIQDDSARALVALAAMYAPGENEDGWSKMVCAGMTEGGCAYFKENQASDLWQSQSSNIGSSSGFIANIQTLTEDTQLWRAQVTVFTPEKETISEVFAILRQGSDGQWFLDRVLSGPGLPLP